MLAYGNFCIMCIHQRCFQMPLGCHSVFTSGRGLVQSAKASKSSQLDHSLIFGVIRVS